MQCYNNYIVVCIINDFKQAFKLKIKSNKNNYNIELNIQDIINSKITKKKYFSKLLYCIFCQKKN